MKTLYEKDIHYNYLYLLAIIIFYFLLNFQLFDIYFQQDEFYGISLNLYNHETYSFNDNLINLLKRLPVLRSLTYFLSNFFEFNYIAYNIINHFIALSNCLIFFFILKNKFKLKKVDSLIIIFFYISSAINDQIYIWSFVGLQSQISIFLFLVALNLYFIEKKDYRIKFLIFFILIMLSFIKHYFYFLIPLFILYFLYKKFYSFVFFASVILLFLSFYLFIYDLIVEWRTIAETPGTRITFNNFLNFKNILSKLFLLISQIIHPYHIKFQYTDNYFILTFFPVIFLMLVLFSVNNFSDKSYFFAITMIVTILIYFFQFSFDKLSNNEFLESRYYALPVLLISIFYGVMLSLTRFKSLLITILIIFTIHSFANSYNNRIQHIENLDFKLKIISSLKDQIVLDKKNHIVLNEIEPPEINKINKIFQTGIAYQLITYLYQNKYFKNKNCLFSKEMWSTSFVGVFKCENLFINFFDNKNISKSESINIIKLSINYKHYNQNLNPWKFNIIEFKVNNETNNSF